MASLGEEATESVMSEVHVTDGLQAMRLLA